MENKRGTKQTSRIRSVGVPDPRPGGGSSYPARPTTCLNVDHPKGPPKSDPSERVDRHPEFFFNDTLVTIQVEKTLFNVHKYQLAKSEVFSEKFKARKHKDEPQEGSSPERPIKLNGVSASDFEVLLKVLYARHFSSNPPAPEASLVIPAFRLATLLRFSELRTYLLPLAEKHLDDVDKIVFSRQFGVNEWMVPAHIRLCQRKEPLSGNEARNLGIESVLIISRMREQHRNRLTVNCNYCSACAGMIYTGKDYECNACGGGHGVFRYYGLGTAVQSAARVDNAAIEADHPNELSSPKPSTPISRHPEFFFDNTLIAIQIESTLFNVHKYQLTKSEVFSKIFQMPKPKGDEPEEGSSPEHPIIIHGAAAADFAALLRILYASHFPTNPSAPEAPLIIPAFRLANLLGFSEIRAYLLPLAEKNLDDIEKIIFAREFGIKDWVAPAYVRLCKRDTVLSSEEASKLGVDGVLVIWRMREQYRSQDRETRTGGYYCYGCTGLEYVQAQVSAFGAGPAGGFGNHSCECCNSPANLRCNGPGNMRSVKTNKYDSSLDVAVAKWVEDSYATKRT